MSMQCMEAMGHEHVVEAMGHEHVVEAMGHEHVVEAMGHEHVVEAMEQGHVVETMGHEHVVEAMGHEHVVEAMGHEHVVVEAMGHEHVVEALGHEHIVEAMGHEHIRPSSYITKLIPAPFDSYDQDPFGNSGVNFSGCRVQIHNMDSEDDASKAWIVVVEYRFTIWILRMMPLRLAIDILLEEEMAASQEKSKSIKAEAMKDVCSIYPYVANATLRVRREREAQM